MAKTRPPGGRPPGRRGGSGIGPGPGYRPTSTGGGTSHKSSTVEGTPMVGIVYAIAGFVVLTVGGVLAFLLHGYGVLL